MDSVLCFTKHEASIRKVLFKETSTLGIRRCVSCFICCVLLSSACCFTDGNHETKHRKDMTRFALAREMISVDAFDRSVAVKVGYLGNDVVNVYPEYEHCKVRSHLKFAASSVVAPSNWVWQMICRQLRSRRSCRCSRSSRACSSSPAQRWTRSAKMPPRPRAGQMQTGRMFHSFLQRRWQQGRSPTSSRCRAEGVRCIQ